jgi:hypothetical protein
MPVPTLLFWEQVLVEEERRTALKKLRYYASLLLNLAAVLWAAGVAMRLRTMQAGPVMQMPVFLVLFFVVFVVNHVVVLPPVVAGEDVRRNRTDKPPPTLFVDHLTCGLNGRQETAPLEHLVTRDI